MPVPQRELLARVVGQLLARVLQPSSGREASHDRT
jgi:hypothetical protein